MWDPLSVRWKQTMRKKRKSLSTFIKCVKRMKSVRNFKTKFVTSLKNHIKSRKPSNLMSTNKSYKRFPKTLTPNTSKSAINIFLKCHFSTHLTKRPFLVLQKQSAGESLIPMKSLSAKERWQTLQYCREGQWDWSAREINRYWTGRRLRHFQWRKMKNPRFFLWIL